MTLGQALNSLSFSHQAPTSLPPGPSGVLACSVRALEAPRADQAAQQSPGASAGSHLPWPRPEEGQGLGLNPSPDNHLPQQQYVCMCRSRLCMSGPPYGGYYLASPSGKTKDLRKPQPPPSYSAARASGPAAHPPQGHLEQMGSPLPLESPTISVPPRPLPSRLPVNQTLCPI